MALAAQNTDVEFVPKEDLDKRFSLMFDSVTVDEVDTEKHVQDQLAYLEVLRDRIVRTAENANKNILDSRDKSLALTKLEEALHWFERAVLADG